MLESKKFKRNYSITTASWASFTAIFQMIRISQLNRVQRWNLQFKVLLSSRTGCTQPAWRSKWKNETVISIHLLTTRPYFSTWINFGFAWNKEVELLFRELKVPTKILLGTMANAHSKTILIELKSQGFTSVNHQSCEKIFWFLKISCTTSSWSKLYRETRSWVEISSY